MHLAKTDGGDRLIQRVEEAEAEKDVPDCAGDEYPAEREQRPESAAMGPWGKIVPLAEAAARG